MSARVQREDVIHALRIDLVIGRYGIKGRRSGREFRTKLCPSCGLRSRDSVVINLDTGRWIDHAHGCSGDAFALIAGFEGLDAKTQFSKVLELAAEIAGVVAVSDPTERARRRTDVARREELRREAEASENEQRRQDAIKRATACWGRLACSSSRGESYLLSRGVADVRGRGLVRFTDDGDIAVALNSADSEIINVVRRRISGEPKVLGMAGCPTAGTLVDPIADIAHGRDVVLVEGVFDALTARIAWPSAVVLGAHGAGNLPGIAEAAARRIAVARTRLLLVPHADEAGERAMIAAGRIAIAAGLQLSASLVVIDCGAKDLNDGWCAGWRPQ